VGIGDGGDCRGYQSFNRTFVSQHQVVRRTSYSSGKINFASPWSAHVSGKRRVPVGPGPRWLVGHCRLGPVPLHESESCP